MPNVVTRKTRFTLFWAHSKGLFARVFVTTSDYVVETDSLG
jgi:hypothetical protein